MNFLIKDTKKDITEFSIIRNTVFYIKCDELFIENNLIKKGEFSFFGIYKEMQFVFDEDNFNTLIFDINGNLIMKITEYALRHIFTFTNGNSLVGGNDGHNVFYGIYNFSKKALLKRFDKLGFNGVYQVLTDKLFLSQNNEKFGVFTFENNCIWECYYKDLFDRYEPLGAGTTNILKVGNKLYVELDKTYGIDIETGKKEQVYDYKFTNSENEFLYGLQFLSMTEFQLAILNTKTNKVKIIDVSDEFNNLNVYPDNRIVVNNGLVYFSQNMGDSIAKIGVLNPESGKILWKHNFEKKNGMIGTIKVSGNRIYAHTQDKTLHIFERDPTPTRHPTSSSFER